jgi:hypothetical protein
VKDHHFGTFPTNDICVLTRILRTTRNLTHEERQTLRDKVRLAQVEQKVPPFNQPSEEPVPSPAA